MLTVYVRTSEDRIEIGHGESRAQFERQDDSWVPVWMWHGDRRMLRFKNHEWLTLGHVRPKASDWQIVADTAERVLVRFTGQDSYFGVPIEWSVSVGAESRWPGFTITTEIIPLQRIELFECFSRFETPYEYDGHEEVLCMTGQNPLTHWRGEEHRALQAGRILPIQGPSNQLAHGACSTRTPICCLRLTPGESPERYVTLLGHWDICSFRALCVAPTDFVDGHRAYEFLVGVLDPRCNASTEPNVFFEGNENYRQRVSISFSPEMPGGTLDLWFYGTFERSLRHHFPKASVVDAEQRARTKKVTLAEANAWLVGMIAGDEVPGLYSPEAGIVNYVEGTSANAGRFSLALLTPWLGALGYQCYVTRREDFLKVCERLVERVAIAINGARWMSEEQSCLFHEILPLLRYLQMFPNDVLQGATRRALDQMREMIAASRENDLQRDFGLDVFRGEAYLLTGQLSGDKGLIETGLACLERVNSAVRGRFLCLGQEERPKTIAAMTEVRPLVYGHAILSNLIAYQQRRDEPYIEIAGLLARCLVSLCYSTFNDSTDPDFDTRGFANATAAGNDRPMECSPLETSDSLRCITYWLGFRADNPTGFYDLMWLWSRTFCGVFPAAREQRTGSAADGRQVSYRNEDIPTAIAYRRFPYVAYENPLRQTHQSPRTSVEVLLNYLTFGGGLASCDNERLLVLAPRAGGFDLAERVGRLVHVYNPGDIEEETHLAIHSLSARRQFEVFVGKKRIASGLTGDELKDFTIQIPPRRVVVVEATPSRQPTAF